MTWDRFEVTEAASPSDEDMAVLQRMASEMDTMLMFLNGKTADLLQQRAKEADTDPATWLIRALNLQADVDAGRVSVIHPRTETILPLGDW